MHVRQQISFYNVHIEQPLLQIEPATLQGEWFPPNLQPKPDCDCAYFLFEFSCGSCSTTVAHIKLSNFLFNEMHIKLPYSMISLDASSSSSSSSILKK